MGKWEIWSAFRILFRQRERESFFPEPGGGSRDAVHRGLVERQSFLFCVADQAVVGRGYVARFLGEGGRDYETTPIQTMFSANETVTIIDPRHPLYDRTFPLLDIANRAHIGRACVIQLRDGLERIVPLAVTDRCPGRKFPSVMWL